MNDRIAASVFFTGLLVTGVGIILWLGWLAFMVLAGLILMWVGWMSSAE